MKDNIEDAHINNYLQPQQNGYSNNNNNNNNHSNKRHNGKHQSTCNNNNKIAYDNHNHSQISIHQHNNNQNNNSYNDLSQSCISNSQIGGGNNIINENMSDLDENNEFFDMRNPQPQKYMHNRNTNPFHDNYYNNQSQNQRSHHIHQQSISHQQKPIQKHKNNLSLSNDGKTHKLINRYYDFNQDDQKSERLNYDNLNPGLIRNNTFQQQNDRDCFETKPRKK